MTTYWPGTNVIKSTDNDFNWKSGESLFLKAMQDHIRQSTAGKLGGIARVEIGLARGETFYISSATKFNGKGQTV
jgi:hypothetical protein